MEQLKIHRKIRSLRNRGIFKILDCKNTTIRAILAWLLKRMGERPVGQEEQCQKKVVLLRPKFVR